MLNKKTILLASAFSLMANVNYAHAVEPKPATSKLDTITVVATKTKRSIKEVPQQVSVISTDEPGISTSSKISEVLRNVPGLNFNGGPVRSGETPTMRGFDSTSLIITQDGRRLNFESQHDGRLFIDPSLIKKIEVVKGPASALHGSGGLGGVIAFETKDAADFLTPGENEGAQIRAGYQSVNEEGSYTLTGYKRSNIYDAVASITHRKSEDIELSDGRTQRSNDNIISGLGKFSYDIDTDSTVEVGINSYNGNSKENTNPQAGPSQTSGRNLVKKDIAQQEASLKYTFDPESELVDMRSHIYFVDTDVEELVRERSSTTSPLNVPGDVLDRRMQTLGFNLENTSNVDVGTKENALTYGLDFFRNEQEGSDSDSTANSGLTGTARPGVPNAESMVFGAFLQDELKFDLGAAREFYITPAIRFDHYKNEAASSAFPDSEEDAISPKIGATYKHNENFSVFSNYGQAFRAPNLTELYSQGVHFRVAGLANTFTVNPYLKPEKATTFEYGTNFNFTDILEEKDVVNLKLSKYETKSDDYIEQVVAGSNIGNPFICPFPFVAGGCSAGTTSFTNVPKADIWGYEADFTYENELLIGRLGASYTQAKNARTGTRLTTKQPFIVTSDLGFKIPQLDLIVGHFGKYADDNKKGYYDASDPQNIINYRRPGFATHGIYASYAPEKLENLTVDMGVDNIFNKKFREPLAEIYSPSTNYKVDVTWKF